MVPQPRAITPNTGTRFATTLAPDTPTSIASTSYTLSASAKDLPQAQLAPIIANTSLRSSASPKSARTVLSPSYSPRSLTGAAAMADARQVREKRARDDSRTTSPNPGQQAVQHLLGQGMSTSNDAPAAVAKMSDPLAKAAKSIQIPNNVNSDDPTQTSPVSMSSFGSLDTTTAPTATAMNAIAPDLDVGNGVDAATTPKPSVQELARDAQNSDNRAYTFPGPIDQASRANPNRGMSLPMAHSHDSPQTRSPSISQSGSGSSKRHKCPYCSTDFTRHHNLKSHLLTHSQEKPFECGTCNSRFRRLHDLKRHSKLHTGERPHTCPKCGRRFARGDALARHNKGAGGCAGRRSSFGGPEDGVDDSMDGLEYSEQQTEEPEGMDEDGPDARRADVAQMGRGSATYPPIQSAPLVRGSMYPPPGPPSGSGSSANAGPPRTSEGTHYPPVPQPSFSQMGMTESPGPLSPGQEHGHRGSLSARSADFQSYTSRSRASSHVGQNHNPPQLPSLAGLSSTTHPPSTLSHQILPPGGHRSNPGSHSSHERSSGGSIREVLGVAPPVAGTEMLSVVRDLEAQIARRDQEYAQKMGAMHEELIRLREEIKDLRGAR